MFFPFQNPFGTNKQKDCLNYPNNFSFEWKKRLLIRDGHQKRILVVDLSGLLWILLWSTLVYAVSYLPIFGELLPHAPVPLCSS